MEDRHANGSEWTPPRPASSPLRRTRLPHAAGSPPVPDRRCRQCRSGRTSSTSSECCMADHFAAPHGSERIARLRYLLQQMQTVDIRSLYIETRRIQVRLLWRHADEAEKRDTGAVKTTPSGPAHTRSVEDQDDEAQRMSLSRDAEMVEHMLCYLQYFLECASAFVSDAAETAGEAGRQRSGAGEATLRSENSSPASRATRRMTSRERRKPSTHRDRPLQETVWREPSAASGEGSGILGSVQWTSRFDTGVRHPAPTPCPPHSSGKGAPHVQRGASASAAAHTHKGVRPSSTPPAHPLATEPSGSSSSLLQRIAHAVEAQEPDQQYGRSCTTGTTVVTLTPGVYRESLLLEPCQHRPSRQEGETALELVAGPQPGAAVLLFRRVAHLPILHISGQHCLIRLRGLVFVDDCCDDTTLPGGDGGGAAESTGGEGHPPPLPILYCTDGATVVCEACHFYGHPHPRAGMLLTSPGMLGPPQCQMWYPFPATPLSSALVRCQDAGTSLELHLCLFSYCHQSGQDGAEVGDGAALTMRHTKVRHCGIGVHALPGGTLWMRDSSIDHCGTAGLVAQRHSHVHLQRCGVYRQRRRRGATRSTGRGVWLQTGARAELEDSMVELNGSCGIEREKGSSLRLQRSYVRDNGVGNVMTKQ